MKTDDLARYYQDYLSRQPSRFGLSPQQALAQLRDVMQWPQAADADEKSGRESPAGMREQEKQGGPRLLRAG